MLQMGKQRHREGSALCQQSHVSPVTDRKLRLGEAASHV